MTLWKNLLVGLAVSAIFALLYITGILSPLENKLYDLSLRFRSDRPHIDSVVFLDVDATAIAYNGASPWPRSIPADDLLHLKEYGARAAIFDIDYIDSILALIGAEGENDHYLTQALALFGRGWLPLNLHNLPLNRENPQPRLLVEERFSYPVKAADDAHRGEGFIDILPMLSEFAQAAKGSGFNNIEPDNDGLIRRVYLAQNVHGHWYLPLALAPLIDYLGRPDIVLEKQKLIIKQIQTPDEQIVHDIIIPLDTKGRMLLDWPKTDYKDTFSHSSFTDISLLAEIESELEIYSRALATADLNFFIQLDPKLSGIPFILSDMKEFFDAAQTKKDNALEHASETFIADEFFNAYLAHRNLSYALMSELLALNPVDLVQALIPRLSEFPERAETAKNEAEYIIQLLDTLELNLKRWHEFTESNNRILRDKFCIIGKAGIRTHGVILDTILSEYFIYPVSQWLNALIILIFIPLCVLASTRLSPLKRFATVVVVTALIVAGSILLLRFANIFCGPTGIVLALPSALITRETVSYITSKKVKRR
jgi:adenylate cyclase